jgi:hypothetical protein
MISESRIQLLKFIDLLSQETECRLFAFREPSLNEILFSMLFESGWQDLALKLIGRGLKQICTNSNQFASIFQQISKLLQECLNNKNDQQWIDLLLRFLPILQKRFQRNRTLRSYVDRFNVLIDLAILPSISDELRDRIDLANSILKCSRSICSGSAFLRKKLSQLPMKTIVELIKELDFGIPPVNLFLELIFEIDISLTNLPDTAEILNAKLLPQIHEATQHLSLRSEIFQFLHSICQKSQINQLKVFRSHFLISILEYIRSFPDCNCTSDERNQLKFS